MSVRIPNKNLKTFFGKPLIYWTIKASKLSRYIKNTLVTSDSDEILNVAKKNKVDFLIKRPKYLSTSKVSSWDVVRHSINNLKKKGFIFDFIILLQPTSPLRNTKHIDLCIKKFNFKNTGCVSICKTKPIEWVARLNKNKDFKSFELGLNKYKSVNNKNSYIINGAIYFFKTSEVFKKNFMFKKSVKTFEMDPFVSIDIDTKKEFKFAEFLKKLKI